MEILGGSSPRNVIDTRTIRKDCFQTDSPSLAHKAPRSRQKGCPNSVKNTAQIVVQCSGRNTLCYNKITTCTNSSYVKVIMSLMKDKSSMKYSLQCSGRNTEAESETNS